MINLFTPGLFLTHFDVELHIICQWNITEFSLATSQIIKKCRALGRVCAVMQSVPVCKQTSSHGRTKENESGELNWLKKTCIFILWCVYGSLVGNGHGAPAIRRTDLGKMVDLLNVLLMDEVCYNPNPLYCIWVHYNKGWLFDCWSASSYSYFPLYLYNPSLWVQWYLHRCSAQCQDVFSPNLVPATCCVSPRRLV